MRNVRRHAPAASLKRIAATAFAIIFCFSLNFPAFSSGAVFEPYLDSTQRSTASEKEEGALYADWTDDVFSEIMLSGAESTAPTAGSGSALSFDGVDDYISIPYTTSTRLSGSSDFTISMWVWSNNKSGNVFQQNAYNGQLEAFFRIVDGYVNTGLGKQSTLWQRNYGTIRIEFGRWNHLAMTKSGKNIRTYINGVKDIDYTMEDTNPVLTAAQPSTAALFGGTGSYFFSGRLDEIQYWNTSLSQSTITDWMYREVDPTHPNYGNLVLYYKLNEGSGSPSVIDGKGSFNGSMVGMSDAAWVGSNIKDWVTDEDTPVSGYLFGSSPIGAADLLYEIINPGAIGTAEIIDGNRFTYTPNSNLNGSDSFTYRVIDINSAASDVQSVSVTINAVNDAPTASGVRILGFAQKDNVLTGAYTFSDLENDAEGTSNYKWYRSDDASGTGKTAITDAVSSSYTVTAGDVGKYLSFEVTPVASAGTAVGLPVESAYTAAVVESGYFAGGDGSSSNPYQIANATQLELMATLVNGDTAPSYYNKHYILTADIVMPTVAAGQSNHSPIGSNENYYFRGSFDGQNHSISGIKIDKATEEKQGFFGFIYTGAVVKNVRIINASISARAWSGGIAYYNTGIIENSSYAGVLKGGISSGDYAGTCIGGIAGVNQGTIDKCINYSAITTGVSENINQSSGCGGIAGDNYGTIRNCYNSGSITTPVGSSMIGGIVGHNRRGNALNNYNTGTINAAGSVGGIVGYNYGNVQNNYNIASLSSASKPEIVGGGVCLGAIAGKNYINSTAYGTVKYSYWLNNSLNGVGEAEGVYDNCASFLNTGGTLTAAAGHTIIEDKTNLVDALNAWTAAENNKTGKTTYMYWKSSGGYPIFTPAYQITVDGAIQNGSISVNKTAAEGQTVTFTPLPAEGYKLTPGSVDATYNGGIKCTLTPAENGGYTFVMPAYAVTVTAQFEIIPYIDITLSSTTGNYVVASSDYIDSAVTVESPLDIAGGSVNINGFISGDVLSFENSASVTGSYNYANGVLTISGTAKAADYEAFLRSIKFSTSAKSGTRTFEILLSNTSNNALYYSQTGHFYEYVSTRTTWSLAKSDAEKRFYPGVEGNGYLATITSAGENEFISEKLGSDAWIGASDAESEGIWKWVSGPEANHLLGADYPYYTNWAAGEPNNSSGNEDYAEIYVATGYWNDLNGTQAYGYVVEYGYDYYELSGSGTAMKTITIVKKDPVVAWPAVSEITYGQTFSEALTGGVADVDGTFSIEDAAEYPGAGTHMKTITFTPADTENYNTVSETVSIVVNKANAAISDIVCLDKIYNGLPLAPSSGIIKGDGSIVFTYSGGAISGTTTEAPKDAGTYVITATLAESANYNAASKTKTVVISKATPSYSVPTGLTATYGQTLADVTLPANFSWEDAAATSVGNAGSNAFTVLYTPTDTVNYNKVTAIAVSIVVNKANAAISDIVCLDKIYNGLPLAPSSGIIKGDGSIVFTYSGGAISGTTTEAPKDAGTYVITATLAESANYNAASKTKTVVISKATPSYSAPSGLTAIYGQTLADVTLPANFSWEAETTTTVGDVGLNTFTVLYTPTDTVNYNEVTHISVWVTVNKAEQAAFMITGKPTVTPVYGDTFTLGTSGGSGIGPVTWSITGGATVSSGGTVTITDVAEVSVTAIKAGDRNYNVASDTYTFIPQKATPAIGTVYASSIFVGEGLEKSTLTRSDLSVSGTLSWEENAGFLSAAGSKSVTFRFTPTGVDAGRYNALTGQSVTLTVQKRDILSVFAQDAINNKSFGTSQADAGLPAQVTVTVQGTDGSVTRAVPVAWTGYNPNTLNVQTLTGTLNLVGNEELINTDGKSALVSVTLQPLMPKSISDVSAKIKVGSSDGAALLKALVTGQFDESVDAEATGAAHGWDEIAEICFDAAAETQTVTVRVLFKYGYAPVYQDVTINYEIVNPSSLCYTVSTVPTIDATDERNAAAAAILDYVNGYTALTVVWSEDAVGATSAADGAPEFTALPATYVQTGTVYNFSMTYLGHTISQSLTVNEVKQETPVLTVDYGAETVDTTADMAYSVESGIWSVCEADMPISPWLGKTVSFKTSASGYKVDSNIVEIAFPSREIAPASLTAVINDAKTEITVLGLQEGIAYEYSLDGESFSDLSSDGKIAVGDYINSVDVRKKHAAGVSVHSMTAEVLVKYTMTFDSCGGSAVAAAYAVSGMTVPEPAAPRIGGFKFIGWYDTKFGEGSKIVFPYTMTRNITVYARWDRKQDGSSGDALIITDGTSHIAGKTQTTTSDGENTTTVTIDTAAVESVLEQSGKNAALTIPVTDGSGRAVVVMSGQAVKSMEEKDAVLEITTPNVTYTLPASEIDIDELSAQLGEQVQLSDITVNISIAEASQDDVLIAYDTADKNNYEIIVKPVEFEITCAYRGETVTVSQFYGYVERTIAIPDGVDPSKITTGVVVNADGTFTHVPTTIVVIDGKYYAKINSLTNSVYSVIYNPVKFSDMEGHWAKDAVNDMGSRLVANGIDNGLYAPDRDITRAEFAAVIVRALGLKAGVGEIDFADVRGTDWHYGYIKTAASYGIILGYEDKTFGPNDKITREQAMVMIERAMKITRLEYTLSEGETASLLSGYKDAPDASDYAKQGIAACLKALVVTGTDSGAIAPKDYITRAQAAVILRRLLQKSGLI